MVIDFGDLDGVLKNIIKEWDHAFMVETTDPFAQVLADFGVDEWRAVKLVRVAWAPTAENIAQELYGLLLADLPSDIALVTVEVFEGAKSAATVSAEP